MAIKKSKKTKTEKKPATAGNKTQKPKKIDKSKNISIKIPNGTLVITNDKYFHDSDGKSTKTRMAGVIDSNRKNELAIVKYTTSKKNGRPFKNDKGFKGHGDTVYTLDEKGKPIKIDNVKFFRGPKKRMITKNQANEIKRRSIKESKNKDKNLKHLQNLKGRNNKKRGN